MKQALHTGQSSEGGAEGRGVDAYIALGSNLGDRRGLIGRAVEGLNSNGIEVVKCSGMHETAAVGMARADAGAFINAVVWVRTTLPPAALLQRMREIESELGRTRQGGVEAIGGSESRTIDLDMLLYGDLVINTRPLSVPHPRMHERRFVLGPLAEIAPGAVHPVLRKAVGELLAALG